MPDSNVQAPSYHWTEDAAEIASLAPMADAIEVAGCVDAGDCVERCDGEESDMFSVYLHFTPEWPSDPNGLAGALCIADRNTLAEALAFAAELSAAYGLAINNFASSNSTDPARADYVAQGGN